MAYFDSRPEPKARIQSVVVKEFGEIDHLSDTIASS